MKPLKNELLQSNFELQTHDVLVRNIPSDVLIEIQKQANENLRSRNNEIVAILRKGVK